MTTATKVWVLAGEIDHVGLQRDLMSLGRYLANVGLDEIALANYAALRADLRCLSLTPHDRSVLARIGDVLEEAS